MNTKIYIIKGFVIFLVLALFGILLNFFGTGLLNFWKPVLSLIPKTGNLFLDFLVHCFAVVVVMVFLCYVLGRFFATKAGMFFRKSFPILRGMSEQNNYLGVQVKCFDGIWLPGVITGKQKTIVNSVEVVGPKVCVAHSLTSCFVAFIDKREKIRPTDLSPADVAQIQISMGFLGPEVIRVGDDSELDSYFS